MDEQYEEDIESIMIIVQLARATDVCRVAVVLDMVNERPKLQLILSFSCWSLEEAAYLIYLVIPRV